MSPTQQRDRVAKLAKRDARKALEQSRQIHDPWFRAQALAWVARFTDDDPRAVAREAAKAADECDDAYKRTAVRAWEIVALAECGLADEARKVLQELLRNSRSITPPSSRVEALMLLLQSAFAISERDAQAVNDELQSSCGDEVQWRCQRAVRDAARLIRGEIQPRPFFW